MSLLKTGRRTQKCEKFLTLPTDFPNLALYSVLLAHFSLLLVSS